MAELFFPRLASPIYQGAQIVCVTGGVAGYEVEVYVNYQAGDNPAGRGRFTPLDLAVVMLADAVKEGDKLVAMQVGGGGQPDDSVRKVVTVEKVPSAILLNGEKFPPPKVAKPLYKCQQGFWVSDLVEGVQITTELPSGAGQVSTVNAQTPWQLGWVWAPAPGLGQDGVKLAAVQATQGFPHSNFPLSSDKSQPPTSIDPAPDLQDPRFKPKICEESVSLGANVVRVCNTLPGARVRIYTTATDPKTGKTIEYGVRVAGGGCSVIDLDRPLTDAHPLAEQWLCDGLPRSLSSDPVTIKQTIDIPEIERPICVGSTEVRILNTELGALVEVRAEPSGRHGAATANGSRTMVNLSGKLQDGDQVQVRQSNAGQQPQDGWNPTPGIPVDNPAASSAILNDDDPELRVFYLGQSVRFRVIDCPGAQEKANRVVRLIHQTTSKEQIQLPLIETKTGYFEATWQIPLDLGNVPAGKYLAKFDNPGPKLADIPFSVIRLTVGDTKAILEVHNKWRADATKLSGVTKAPSSLTWSHNLAEDAQEWANYLAADVHKPVHHNGGENIASQTKGYMTPAQLAEIQWIAGDAKNQAEIDIFIPPCDQYGPNCSKTNNKVDIGHYTQVVWAATKEVGCGLAPDPTTNNEYLVGRYAPEGNVDGQPVFG